MRITIVFASYCDRPRSCSGCFNPRIADGGFVCDPAEPQPCPEGYYCRNFERRVPVHDEHVRADGRRRHGDGWWRWRRWRRRRWWRRAAATSTWRCRPGPRHGDVAARSHAAADELHAVEPHHQRSAHRLERQRQRRVGRDLQPVRQRADADGQARLSLGHEQRRHRHAARWRRSRRSRSRPAATSSSPTVATRARPTSSRSTRRASAWPTVAAASGCATGATRC